MHAMWAETRVWTPYWPPGTPHQLAAPGANDSWMNMAAAVDADLGWLLRRKAHRFWSQICHDDGLHQWLESLLETFPRSHEPNAEVAAVEARQQQLLHRLFLVFVRLCTYKESTTDFFTPEYYGNMIYDKFLIEVPKILDICVLFGPFLTLTHKRTLQNEVDKNDLTSILWPRKFGPLTYLEKILIKLCDLYRKISSKFPRPRL